MDPFWTGFEKQAMSMSGVPGYRSGARLGKITTPPVGVMTQPRSVTPPLPLPRPVKTVAAPQPQFAPAKSQVPKPTTIAGQGTSSMAI